MIDFSWLFALDDDEADFFEKGDMIPPTKLSVDFATFKLVERFFKLVNTSDTGRMRLRMVVNVSARRFFIVGLLLLFSVGVVAALKRSTVVKTLTMVIFHENDIKAYLCY